MASLDHLEQEVAHLDAHILAAVRRRSDLARSLGAVEVADPADSLSSFTVLGPDGRALERTLARLSAQPSHTLPSSPR